MLSCPGLSMNKKLMQKRLEESGVFLPDEAHTPMHLFYLVWEPLISHASSFYATRPFGAPRQADVTRCSELLGPRFSELLVDDALEGKSTDEVGSVLYMYLIQFLDCEVDLLSVQAVLATVMPFSMPCTLLNGFTLLVCGAFQARLGPSLAAKLRRRALAFVLDQEDRVPED